MRRVGRGVLPRFRLLPRSGLWAGGQAGGGRRWGRGGHWQLNELGGVKPLAFGQYGELGPGFEQLLGTSWRRKVRTKRPSGTSSPTAQ
jgi:hypothetical protein